MVATLNKRNESYLVCDVQLWFYIYYLMQWKKIKST